MKAMYNPIKKIMPAILYREAPEVSKPNWHLVIPVIKEVSTTRDNILNTNRFFYSQ